MLTEAGTRCGCPLFYGRLGDRRVWSCPAGSGTIRVHGFLRGGGALGDQFREVSRLVGKKRIDWAAIQAEYIGGNIGQKRLAKKYGIAANTLQKRAQEDGWYRLKLRARAESGLKAVQKTAEAAADNALTAARIKAKLLERLEKLADVVLEATEERSYDGDQLVAINRLRDLTAAYKDLTGDLPKGEAGEDALAKARELLGGIESAIG